MQTFLPSPNFNISAAILDNQRLGNQCYREVRTLIRGGWPNHPASKMWRGYEHALARYGLALALEMQHRKDIGKAYWKDRVLKRWRRYYKLCKTLLPDTGNPPWLGDPEFHAAHRANLLRKDREYYGQFNWLERPQLGYIWPNVGGEK